MARKKQTRGACGFCGKEMTRGGLSRHLKTCDKRQEAIAQIQKGKDESIYHLQVQDAWGGDYWLHLEMRASATLLNLDDYLRSIWLECCGHLSHFAIGGGWGGQELAISSKVGSIFEPGVSLTHLYDYGTTSETIVKVVDVRQGKPLSPKPIYLMARNFIPEETCKECGAMATWLCIECIYEHDEPGWLCDEHVKDHPHYNYGEPFPVMNSPRMGMCGYCGPADPPY